MNVICFKTKNGKLFLVSESINEKRPVFGFANSFHHYSFLDWRMNRSVSRTKVFSVQLTQTETGNRSQILGRNQKTQIQLDFLFSVLTDRTNLLVNVSFSLVGGPSTPPCFWLASVLHQLCLRCILQNKRFDFFAFRKCQCQHKISRQTDL